MTEVGIIGPGFAGIGVAIELRRAGITRITLLERAADLGGVWRAVAAVQLLLLAAPHLAAPMLQASGNPRIPWGHCEEARHRQTHPVR
ncbi:NAD(P)-binding protein [Kibdelosporangium phytohabitans]|uniref:NAD(P)-binding protein n=1 Tax=Kibdelosporangium phytohabitans TaxID=860235 RepID=UPI0019FEC669|nr:cation diffusion facilitator CzcD-associated flavoprotein CzcO [Kibdelosporangium phytohabitans]